MPPNKSVTEQAPSNGVMFTVFTRRDHLNAPLLSNLCGCNYKIAQTPSLGILTVINNMSGVCQVFVFLSLVSVFCLLKPLWVLFSAHRALRELEVLPCRSRRHLEKCVFSLHFQIRHSFLFHCVCSLYGGSTSSVGC